MKNPFRKKQSSDWRDGVGRTDNGSKLQTDSSGNSREIRADGTTITYEKGTGTTLSRTGGQNDFRGPGSSSDRLPSQKLGIQQDSPQVKKEERADRITKTGLRQNSSDSSSFSSTAQIQNSSYANQQKSTVQGAGTGAVNEAITGNYPAPYEGGGTVVSVEHKVDSLGRKMTVTTTDSGVVIQQVDGGTPYRVSRESVISSEKTMHPDGIAPGQDVAPSELIPLEGHPGQFTNGSGKGGHDPVTGNSFSKYSVFDANGEYLGENATLVMNGTTTNYGYSYGTTIPENVSQGSIDLSLGTMIQEGTAVNIEAPRKGGPEEAAQWGQVSQTTDIPDKGGSVEAIEAAVSSPYNQAMEARVLTQQTSVNNPTFVVGGEVVTPPASQATNPSSSASPEPVSNPTYVVGGEVIDPRQIPTTPTSNGGASFEVAGYGENPVDGMGTDPGPSGSFTHQAL